MSIIKSVLEDEYNRLKDMERVYLRKLKDLPRGSIVMKKIKSKKYPYLVYREGKKVKTQYIKKKDLPAIKNQIIQRKKYEKYLQEIYKDFIIIKKAIKKWMIKKRYFGS